MLSSSFFSYEKNQDEMNFMHQMKCRKLMHCIFTIIPIFTTDHIFIWRFSFCAPMYMCNQTRNRILMFIWWMSHIYCVFNFVLAFHIPSLYWIYNSYKSTHIHTQYARVQTSAYAYTPTCQIPFASWCSSTKLLLCSMFIKGYCPILLKSS